MSEIQPWLCEGCPTAPNDRVNLTDGTYDSSVDSFRDGRWRYLHLLIGGQKPDLNKIVYLVEDHGLIYSDEEGPWVSKNAPDLNYVMQGALCGQRIANGECSKYEDSFAALGDSDISYPIKGQ